MDERPISRPWDSSHNEVNSRSSHYPSSHVPSATVQRTSGKTNVDQANRHASDSLMEKFKEHYRSTPKGIKAKKISWFFFHFQAVSQLYMGLNYMIPTLLQDWDPMTQYLFKIIPCYFLAMSEANWWCCILYSSDLPDIRDKPILDDNDWFQSPPDALKNAETIPPKRDKYGFEWKYCKLCDRYKPPRSHHCMLCKKCILRRDHHCYFIGHCIGHYNQRYFIITCFWGIVTTTCSFPVTLSYMLTLPDATWWGDYFLPYTFILFLYYGSVSWYFTILIFHCYAMTFFFCACSFYFTLQITLISAGKTLVERTKKFDMNVTSNLRDRVTMVFGDYWLLNFLFPAQLIFKQRHDGIHYENVKFFGEKKGNE